MDAGRRDRARTAFRFGLMATGMLALIGGLWGGAVRLGGAGPLLHGSLPAAHGPLMVCGFLGTVISLERAVALDRTWAFAAPAATGVGGLLTLAGVGGLVGPLLVTAGSLGLLCIFGVVLSLQAVPFVGVMAAGAASWAVGNGLWLWGWPVPALVPWWMGFLVLTIAGERLELSRMLFHERWTRRLVLGLAGALGAGLLVSGWAPDLGFRVVGGALLALALWLGAYDVARRTVREDGLPRFTAVCLLAGYGWLAVGGVLALLYGNPGAGLVYDATLHAVFVGFVFSMIFGHAPVIFPSVLGIAIPYRPLFYVHVALLHGSLTLRLVGGLTSAGPLRAWGGWLNAASILLFLGVTAYSARSGAEDRSRSPVADRQGAPTRDEIPDLQLDSS